MDEKDIPQHGSKIFAGQKKVLYATRNGHYVAGQSSGWDDESFATEQAVQALTRKPKRLGRLIRPARIRRFII